MHKKKKNFCSFLSSFRFCKNLLLLFCLLWYVIIPVFFLTHPYYGIQKHSTVKGLYITLNFTPIMFYQQSARIFVRFLWIPDPETHTDPPRILILKTQTDPAGWILIWHPLWFENTHFLYRKRNY